MSDLAGKKVAVIGLGLSNWPVIEYLTAAGAQVTVADRKTAAQLGPAAERLARYPVRSMLGPGYLGALDGQDMACLTPGLRRDLPELIAASAAGVEFTSEMRLFFEMCPAPIVGITGSAGKTTTTTLTGLMLSASRPGVWVGGNLGRPLLGDLPAIGPGDLVVLELSSFQLQDLRSSPGIAAVLNVSPNHLDMHPSMTDYVDSKRNIYRFQGASGIAVFNYDNETTVQMAGEYAGRRVAAPTGGREPLPPVMFSRVCALPAGAFLDENLLMLRLNSLDSHLPDSAICDRRDVRLLGDHNISNLLAAASLAALAGATPAAITGVATTFRGVEHRLEPVRSVGGVSYYNDSIATAPDRTIAALRALPGPMVLILGGYDKKIAFDDLAQEVLTCGKVRELILTGDTAGTLETALEAAADRLPAGRRALQPAIHRVTGSLAEVVALANRLARPGDLVLLSPACASFDQFANFERRGEAFKRLVAELPGSEPA